MNRNAFGELLLILDEEDLIRLQRRSQLRGNQWLADCLGDELIERALPPDYPTAEGLLSSTGGA